MDIALNRPQAEFMQMKQKYRAFVAGFGSGKTWVGCVSQISHFLQHPGIPQGYFSPTFSMMKDIYYPTITEVAEHFGMRTVVRKGDREVDFYLGNKYYGTTICKTMDNPEAIVGFKIGRALVDELDVLSKDKAFRAWNKIIARLRVKDSSINNGIDVTTTPEGYKEVYERFHKKVVDKPSLGERYGYIKASTYENEINLPDDYIQSLLDSYPEQLIKAYLKGEFTNLEHGAVYNLYDRKKHNCYTEISEYEPLLIGMDFNVERACAAICVNRGKELHAVEEVFNALDTREMIKILKDRFNNPIAIYPDATGRSRKSVNATESDHILLKNAGFSIITNETNPPIKERVGALNNGFDKELVFVNADKCPHLADTLEQQVWKNGMPDKDGKEDINDAFGYVAHKRLKVKRDVLFKNAPKNRPRVGGY